MGLVAATLIVLLVIASVVAQDFTVLSWAFWQEGGQASRSEIVRNLGLLSAGLIGLGFGIWRAYTAYRQTQAAQGQAAAATEHAKVANEQAFIAQQGQFTERFSRAAEHLGSEGLPVRLGGIYALWRLAEDSPERDVVPVIDILCAFVRDPPPAEPPPAEPPHTEPSTEPTTGTADAAQLGEEPSEPMAKLRPDVQAVLKLLGGSAAVYRQHLPDTYRLDLTHSDLSGAHLSGANLTGANLTGANLTGADLAGTDLAGANLTGANLTRANLPRANLARADLWGVNLRSAHLWRANLMDANLRDADLKGAIFTRTRLNGAHLSGADLTGADLAGADFSDADLMRAKHLTQAQLYNIRYDPDARPKLPPGLTLPELAAEAKGANGDAPPSES